MRENISDNKVTMEMTQLASSNSNQDAQETGSTWGHGNNTHTNFNPIHRPCVNIVPGRNIYWNILEASLKRSNTQTCRHTHPASGDAPTDGDNAPLSGPH